MPMVTRQAPNVVFTGCDHSSPVIEQATIVAQRCKFRLCFIIIRRFMMILVFNKFGSTMISMMISSNVHTVAAFNTHSGSSSRRR